MLEFSHNGLEVCDLDVLAFEDLLCGVANLVKFSRGEFNGAVDAIKDPAKDFFVGVPDPFTFQD